MPGFTASFPLCIQAGGGYSPYIAGHKYAKQGPAKILLQKIFTRPAKHWQNNTWGGNNCILVRLDTRYIG
jgi:hypothetical protein